jgi:hypothetical protein
MPARERTHDLGGRRPAGRIGGRRTSRLGLAAVAKLIASAGFVLAPAHKKRWGATAI